MWQLSATSIYDPATGILYTASVTGVLFPTVHIDHPNRHPEKPIKIISGDEAHELWEHLMFASEDGLDHNYPTLLSMHNTAKEDIILYQDE